MKNKIFELLKVVHSEIKDQFDEILITMDLIYADFIKGNYDVINIIRKFKLYLIELLILKFF